jgi:hypothetical protein
MYTELKFYYAYEVINRNLTEKYAQNKFYYGWNNHKIYVELRKIYRVFQEE